MEGASPVEVLTSQILKYQFPSPFSISLHSSRSRVSDRFKIRPFQFMLKLLDDNRIGYLTQEELGKIIIVEAEDESTECYEKIVRRILEFRELGDECLRPDFFSIYAPSSGVVNSEHPFSHLIDVANTLMNWIEYTQMARRENGRLELLPERIEEVRGILETKPPFIDRPEQQEYFQRKYGTDPWHRKDTRNLLNTKSITPAIISRRKIQQAFVIESLKYPITGITKNLIETIAEATGIISELVEEHLTRMYPRGSIDAFFANYFEMAFRGRDDATEFETATVEIFKSVFGFETHHVGPTPFKPGYIRSFP